ncbi:spermatid maturation protein 1 [Choloepus didactylus]|uniref:spermatid maturation protein 1 n=1 Tax=Choloepus didactylus TaxID=27675 RepID=UPI0018A0911E|nr:spermatid maturation protein 1 [Choloepus didactylus]
MAIAEQPQPGWASCHSPSTNTCQDLGNSILVLLGLVICINIGINTVTLLWRRLRFLLRRAFRIICEKEALKSSSPRKRRISQPARKQSSQDVHLRCTMDPVTMTVTPPPTRRHRHRGSPTRRAHRPAAWAPDTNDEEPPGQHPAICSHNWDCPEGWEAFKSPQGMWAPWAQDSLEPAAQTIRFQETIEGRPLKSEVQSKLGLQAYVYPVNPPPPTPEAQSNRNSGPEAEVAPCSPALPPTRGPALVPDIPRHRSSARVVYDARDVRRRLRELTREVEALSHCYPLASGSSTCEGTGQDWVYHSLAGKRLE